MSTFHPFPRLPLELRLAIWEMTVDPREVEVRIVRPRLQDPLGEKSSQSISWSYLDDLNLEKAMSDLPSSTRAQRKAKAKARKQWRPHRHMVSSIIPAAVHTCREARNHGLYQRIYLDVEQQPESDCQYVWLNLDIDLVNIGKTDMVYFKPIASTVKRLKLSRTNADEHWYHHENDLLSSFSSVEEIHVLCLDGLYNWGDSAFDFPWPCGPEKLVFIEEDTPVGYLEVNYLEIEWIHEKIMEEGYQEGFQAFFDEYRAGRMPSID